MAKVLKRQMSAAARGSIMRVDAAHTIEQLNILLISCGEYITDEAKKQIMDLKNILTNPSALIDDINVESFRVGEKSVNQMPTYKLCRVRLPENLKFDAPAASFTRNDKSYTMYNLMHKNGTICETSEMIAVRANHSDAFTKDGMFNIGYSDGENFHVLDIINHTCKLIDLYISDGLYDIEGADKQAVNDYIKDCNRVNCKTLAEYEEIAKVSTAYYEDIINYLITNNIPFIEGNENYKLQWYDSKKSINLDNPVEKGFYTDKIIAAEIAVIPLSDVESFKNKISEKSSFIQDNHILWDYMSRVHQ